MLRQSLSSYTPRGDTPRSHKLDLTITGFSLPGRPMSSRGEHSGNIKRPQSSGSVATEQPRPQNSCSSTSHQARPQSACGPSRRAVAAVPEPLTPNNKDRSLLESLAQGGDRLLARAQDAGAAGSGGSAVAPHVGRQGHVAPKSHGSQDHVDMLCDLERRSFAVHQAAQALQRSREKFLKGVSRQREALRYMKDELATDGNEEVLFKPLASHSRQLQQASDEHERQREVLSNMVSAGCRFKEALQRQLRRPVGKLKRALTEFNAAIEAGVEELAKYDQTMPKAVAWNRRVLHYAAEDEADGEMASKISTTQSSVALSSSSSTAVTDSSPSCASWSATSSTASMTFSTGVDSSTLDGITFH